MIDLAFSDQETINNRDFMKRFWAKAALAENSCLLWKGYVRRDGYPAVKINSRWYKAHRVAYFLSFGNFDKSKVIMHTCDNPRCVNPNHLKVGTLSENTRDMFDKGRGGRSGGGAPRLSEDDVRHLLSLHATGASIHELSRRFGVSRTTIRWRLTRKPSRFDGSSRPALAQERSR